MAAICTASTAPTGCNHRSLTIAWDGVNYIFDGFTDADLNVALTAGEKRQLAFLGARYLRAKGVTLSTFVNRVVFGEEATNVKMYQFFGPGAAITKTNIGTAYVNICVGLNGERQIVDFTGCTEFRIILHANLVGTGAFAARVIRDSDSTVLFESTNLGAAGERELDTDWQAIPAAFLGSGLVALRAQAKSAVGADDPVFRALKVGLR